MKPTVKISDNFTVEDIRRLRDDYAARHTDENGRFDWDGATAETKDGAARVLSEIARIRSERHGIAKFIPEDAATPDETEAIASGREAVERGEYVLHEEIKWS